MVASAKRVLVVDDEAIVCESYKRVLTEAGYSVSTARSGLDAVAACRGEPFDVMLADLKMPDMDGLDVTRTVKKEFPHVQIVIITGYPTPQSTEEARRLGVFDYLHKPLSPERLSAVTSAALASPAKRTAPVAASADVVSDKAVRPVIRPAKPGKDEAEAVSPPTRESVVKLFGVVAAAPLIGLAYVLFLPVIVVGMLFAAVGGSLIKKLGRTST